MKAVTLILLGVVLAAAPASSAENDRSDERVEAYGLSIEVPDGWQARVYRLTPGDAITLQASSASLPPQGELMTGERLGPGDAYIWIADIGNPPESWYWGESKLPLAISSEELDGPYDHGFLIGTGSSARVNDRALNVAVRLGSEASLAEVNDVLATFSVAPR